MRGEESESTGGGGLAGEQARARYRLGFGDGPLVGPLVKFVFF
jgi:hypothetical protein